MKKIELYKSVILRRDLLPGVDFISKDKTVFKKGSKGIVVEKIDEKGCLVEFSYKEYDDPVIGVDYDDLEEVG